MGSIIVVLPKQYLIDQVEYQIRKTERGIKVLFTGGAESKKILEYGNKLEKLKDKLEELAGRREPESPEWPL